VFEKVSVESENVAPQPNQFQSSAATDATQVTGTILANSDACPEPLANTPGSAISAYDAFVNNALSLPPGPDALVMIRISPSFERESTLSLRHGVNGTYVLRRSRLTEDIWGKMMREMQVQQGATIDVDEAHQTAALSRITAANEVLERALDNETAELFLNMWNALLHRAQVVREVGVRHFKIDGTRYRIWQGDNSATTNSPRAGSVLAKAVSSANRLSQYVEGTRIKDSDLPKIRKDMSDALTRTDNQEPCLHPDK
jgi:hypothetical protein